MCSERCREPCLGGLISCLRRRRYTRVTSGSGGSRVTRCASHWAYEAVRAALSLDERRFKSGRSRTLRRAESVLLAARVGAPSARFIPLPEHSVPGGRDATLRRDHRGRTRFRSEGEARKNVLSCPRCARCAARPGSPEWKGLRLSDVHTQATMFSRAVPLAYGIRPDDVSPPTGR